jgi:hypothetical protein
VLLDEALSLEGLYHGLYGVIIRDCQRAPDEPRCHALRLAARFTEQGTHLKRGIARYRQIPSNSHGVNSSDG